MRINLKKFLHKAGILDMFYPGKRLMRPCRQEGAYKSHSVILDWRRPDRIRIEVEAGLSGHKLPLEELRKYPVSFQSPTYVEIAVASQDLSIKEDDEEEDEEGEGGKGRAGGGGGGGIKPLMTKTFEAMAEGQIPLVGDVVEMVIMGTKIAAEAFEKTMEVLTHQIAQTRIAATDILAAAGKCVTRYMPPAFIQPKGDEQQAYCYDRIKNQDIGRFNPHMG